MRHLPRLLGLTLAAATSWGCTRDIAQTCTKLAQLAERDSALPRTTRAAMTDIQACKAQNRAFKRRNPNGYEKYAACVERSVDLSGVIRCAFDHRPRPVPAGGRETLRAR